MVNNVKLIREHLHFDESGDTFYFVQILKRRKENPDMDKGVEVVESFYINSLNSFDRKVPRIIELCNQHNARAYINMNELSHRKVTYEVLSLIAEGMKNDNFRAWMNIGNSACGQTKAAKEKLWLIDLDGDSVQLIDEIHAYINDTPPFVDKKTGEPIGDKLAFCVPTKNGVHMMVRTFDLRDFDVKFPGIDLHKNNPTILYIA